MDWINVVGNLALLYFAAEIIAPDFHRGRKVADVSLLDKLLGAFGGSFTAVFFSWGRDGWLKRGIRLWTGIAAALFGTGATIELMHLQNSVEMNRFVASLLGVLGYSIVQFLLSKDMLEILKSKVVKK